MRTIKRPEFIELLINNWIYLDEMLLYITLSLKCTCIAERMAFYERVSVMTCIVERRAFYERLHATKSQYYHSYAAGFNVLGLADNFVVCQLISKSISSLAS